MSMMTPTLHRIVVDTNVLVRAVVNADSASGRIIQCCDSRALIILLSKAAIAEYRSVLADPEVILRYPQLDEVRVALLLKRLRFVGDVIDTRKTHFDLPRDPTDQKWIELAIAGDATHIISADGDLLSLPSGRSDSSKRFRQRLTNTRIMSPLQFATAQGI